MAVTIVLTNQKGGVGKTTSSAALASGLKGAGYRVLAVDLDSQGNLGFSLGLDMEEEHTMCEVLKGEIPVKDAIRHTEDCADILT
ncbi:ParA family protein, partial [Muricomes intestini]